MRILLTIFLISSLYVPVIKAQGIAQWRGPERNGIYNEVGLLKKWPDKGPRLLWHYDQLGAGHTSASVSQGGVYTTGMTEGIGYVYAFDLNGVLLWKKAYGPEWARNYDGSRSTPLIIDDKLYLMSAFGKLLCMSCKNGETIWSVDLVKEYGARSIEWGMTENLLSDGNILYCTPGGSETSIAALNRHSGKLIWKSKGIGEKSAYCSPIMIKTSERKILVTLMEKSVCGFNPESGLLLWKFEHSNTYNVHPNSPVYSDGHLFCFSENGRGGLMLKLEKGGSAITQLWSSTLIDNITSGAVILNGRIYGTGDRNRKLFCLDMKTGKELFSLGNVAPANIIANDGLLYLYSESGKILLIEAQAERFNIISSFPVPFGSNPHWAHLVLKNRRLYVRHGESIMVYDVAAI